MAADHLQLIGGPVLDAGCGTGRAGEALQAAGVADLVGGDFTPASVEVARRRGVYRSVDHLDLNGRCDFDDDQFAIVVGQGSTSVGEMSATPALTDGLHLIVKHDCPTCVLIEPVIAQLAASDLQLTVYSQDNPDFPAVGDVVDDTDLTVSWHHDIETVPTLLRVEAGIEADRIVGWERSQWEAFTAHPNLAPEIAGYSPGCGSMSVDPESTHELAFRFGATPLRQPRVDFASTEDEVEAMYELGWSDGLPVVAPTEERVLRMLTGTDRDPQDIVAVIPPTARTSHG